MDAITSIDDCMYSEIAKKILEAIENAQEYGLGDSLTLPEIYPKLSGEGYKAQRIDTKNFRPIKKSGSNKRIAFIDGGNAEILGTANFSLNLIRASCAVYLNKKKAAFKKSEFFAFVHALSQNGEIHYKASFYGAKNRGGFGEGPVAESDSLVNGRDKYRPLNERARANLARSRMSLTGGCLHLNSKLNPELLEDVSFSSLDKTLMRGINRAEISSVANAVRRFAELKMAKLASETKEFCDIIVIDGNLQTTMTHEKKYMEEIYDSCSKNNILLTAISKTSSLFTDSGGLLSVVLDSIGKLPSWLYYPVAEISNPNHKAEMLFVKFHSKSNHIFRFEILNSQRASAEEAISILSMYCVDPIFLGYPYGLIEADKSARVSNSERESLKTMFLAKLRSKRVEKHLSSANAHEILDKISF